MMEEEEEEEVEMDGEADGGEGEREMVAAEEEVAPHKYLNRVDIDRMEEPEAGSADWAAYHEEQRLRKHEVNKRRRQIEKAAIGATIAAAKVNTSPTGNEGVKLHYPSGLRSGRAE